MKRLWPIVVAAALIGLPAEANESNHMLSEKEQTFITNVRELFQAQDMVAQGHRSGVAAQKAILARIRTFGEDTFATLPPSPAVAAALAGYVLSGGQPKFAEAYAANAALDDASRQLVESAAFFMSGSTSEAKVRLDRIEPTGLPAEIGGRVALARAMLAGDNEERRELELSLAAALMPGTLIEESALRRSALALAETDVSDRLWARTDRYVRRFSRSLYAAEYLTAIIRKLGKLAASGKHIDIHKLDYVLAALPTTVRRRLYLQLARETSATTATSLAQAAARRLGRLSVLGSVEERLAYLYVSIHDIVGSNGVSAIARLKQIDQSGLDPNDIQLLKAALVVAEQIQAPLPEPERLSDEIAAPLLEFQKREQLGRNAIRLADAALEETNQE